MSETDESSAPMKTVRRFLWEEGADVLVAEIPEVIDPAYGMYVWPCAPVLAQYVWHRRAWLADKHVLELGAGTSLPGVVAAKLGAQVTLSDDCRQPQSLENCRKSCEANKLSGVKVIGLTWGRVSPAVALLEKVDVILASDCFYDSKDFEDVLVTLRYFIDKNADLECWSTYQQRSCDHSLVPLLRKWKLRCRHVLRSAFGAESHSLAGSTLPGDHVIQMMVITGG